MTEEGKVESLVNALRLRIKRGDFGTSGRLPTVTQLAKEYDMARATVYNALQILRVEGLLFVRNSAYVVSQPMLLIEGAPNFDRYMQKQGLTPAFENVVEPEVIEMPEDIAAMFGQSTGIRVVHRVRKQGTSEVPLRLEENWYPVELALPFLDAMKKDASINVAREIRLVTGTAITSIKEYVLSRYATLDESKLLEIARTSPVLEARRNFVTSEGQTVIYNRTIMVAAFFMLYSEYPTSWQKAQE
jgi:DNA-binding GntR family transcriptional regulator